MMSKTDLFKQIEDTYITVCRLNNCKAEIGTGYYNGVKMFALKSYSTITAVALPINTRFAVEFLVLERAYYSATTSQHLAKFMHKLEKEYYYNCVRIRMEKWRGNPKWFNQRHYLENDCICLLRYAYSRRRVFDHNTIKGGV